MRRPQWNESHSTDEWGEMSVRVRFLGGVLSLVLLAAGVTGIQGQPAQAITLPAGFSEQIVFSGLNQPTNIEFSPDGRVFVTEQRGVVKVFDSLADNTPTVFADFSEKVNDLWDRGLLGLALPPDFPANPWVYVLYTYDAPPGQTAPYWDDKCDGVIAGGTNGGNCVVQSRLSRLQANGNVMTGTEQVLIQDWCQQYPSHSTGDLHFGADGMLFVSAGEGASFSDVDFGQFGNPVNPCADPANAGGALRSQDIRTTGDPTGLHGSLLRLDPVTGAAAAGNPNIGSPDLNTRRIVAHGLRNAYRFALRPGTSEVWVGDVGWYRWEEINRVVSPTSSVTNFGWPCYEGADKLPSYDNANLPLCESLYTGGGYTAPHFTYDHTIDIVPGENCTPGGDSVSGLAFGPASGSYPAQYAGALFFADYARNCIWAMKPGAGGVPSTSNIEVFENGASQPVDLAIGPGGELYYVDYSGTVRRIRYTSGNQPPQAVINANPASGPAPLTVNFNATGSSDPDPADQGNLTYQWDFTNDGTWDATSATASHTYATSGVFTAKLRVADPHGAADEKTVQIQPGNTAPTAFVDTPTASVTWAVGDTVSFTGHATDPQQGALPASALSWQLRMQHCETVSDCHAHVVQNWTGVASGSFSAPDHGYPSYLELALTATDAQGLTSTVVRRLDPKTVALTFQTSPSGLSLSAGSFTGTTPFTRTVIQGATTTVSAPSPQTHAGNPYLFGKWSDTGVQTHVITSPAAAKTYTASYGRLPTAVIGATPTTGAAPLAVGFDGTGSTDPDPADQGNLTYQWDFTNDGTWDSTVSRPSHTYTSTGAFTAKLRVTDTLGLAHETNVQIQPGNTAPTAFLDTPSASLTWAVGNTITFSGHATDPQQGALVAAALSWKLRLQHCVSAPDCHSHVVQTWTGVASGSFTAPDHEYPSYLELELVATDQQGLTHTVVRRLDPKTVLLSFETAPAGMVLTVGSFTGATPFVREVIQGSSVTVNAPTLQTIGGAQHQFRVWSDGGAQSHVIIAPSMAQTFTASYGPVCGVPRWGPERRTCMPIRPPINRRVSLWGEPGGR